MSWDFEHVPGDEQLEQEFQAPRGDYEEGIGVGLVIGAVIMLVCFMVAGVIHVR
jgi:hypothetical protein